MICVLQSDDEEETNSIVTAMTWTWRDDWIKAITPGFTMLGLISYGFSRIAVDAFYSQFRVKPEEVGLSYSAILGPTAFLLTATVVMIGVLWIPATKLVWPSARWISAFLVRHLRIPLIANWIVPLVIVVPLLVILSRVPFFVRTGFVALASACLTAFVFARIVSERSILIPMTVEARLLGLDETDTELLVHAGMAQEPADGDSAGDVVVSLHFDSLRNRLFSKAERARLRRVMMGDVDALIEKASTSFPMSFPPTMRKRQMLDLMTPRRGDTLLRSRLQRLLSDYGVLLLSLSVMIGAGASWRIGTSAADRVRRGEGLIVQVGIQIATLRAEPVEVKPVSPGTPTDLPDNECIMFLGQSGALTVVRDVKGKRTLRIPTNSVRVISSADARRRCG